MSIRIENLSFSYNNGQMVLDDIHLEFPEASVTTILGPNGSGKTTLLHIVLGLLTPKSGDLFFNGKRRSVYPQGDLSRMVGLVPQDERIPFDLSLEEFVLLGRAPYLKLFEMPGESDHEIAHNAIREMAIWDLKDRFVPTLSGGERQMAVIARAITQQTKILLMDEPTSHLDLGNRDKVLRMIRKLTEMGITVIVTTHDPNAASLIADQVVLMKKGQIVAAGKLDTIFTSENLSSTFDLSVEVNYVKDRPFVF
ncbi:MAG: ABC transporter ATP-binding protein [Anaerolineaceae bacterium]|nr:ABC transporter ATP-binding protein [Anaerolineaceae bacterium]